ncbi:aminoglycoside phosphotransferase family protein [Xenorhabdus stockiae]|uniref:aminoglycoside phosphotransferase family protein n=1 Tax=Xenorhabdus TaxID=626 RepID=UPI0030F38B05
MFDIYMNRWNLIPDGEPFKTHTSQLLPVMKDGTKAMLKLTHDEDEQIGSNLMGWWDGEGAAKVLAHHDGALLMERATGSESLTNLSRTGDDDKACRIICTVANRLHTSQQKALPALTPLSHWFRALEPMAQTYGGILTHCNRAAQILLSAPRDVVALHGDLHHANILHFGAQGWLAIDPKGLIGERGFDYANMFTNPDLADPNPPVAIISERFAKRLAIVTEMARLDRERMLLWIMAWCGLSTVWFLEEGNEAPITLQVAKLALTELER